MLCQSLNAEFASKGIHVAHIVCLTAWLMLLIPLAKCWAKKVFQKLRESRGMEHDGLILPEKIAETYFHLAQQHRSAWTHEIDLRAFSDVAWWNS